jgi:hypothetical protein
VARAAVRSSSRSSSCCLAPGLDYERASRRRMGDPLTGRGLHQLTQHSQKAYALA